MIWFIFIIGMGVLSRLAGSGFGSKWRVPWLPELLFAAPFGVAFAWALNLTGVHFGWVLAALIAGVATSYAGMQSATWMFLRWQSHGTPNHLRTSTLKPLVDYLAGLRGYKLGDEGYAWTAAALKGFIIGLPVGGLLTAVLWPLGYELGSHANGRVDRAFDPHIVSEVAAGIGGGYAIYCFVWFVKIIGGT